MVKFSIKKRDDNKGKEFIRFILVGVLATMIHYFVYYMLTRTHLNINIAYTTGYLVSFICNFFISNYFTFSTKPNIEKGTRFGLAHLINYFIQIILLNIFLSIGVISSISGILAMGFCVPINFFMVRKALNHKKKEKINNSLFSNRKSNSKSNFLNLFWKEILLGTIVGTIIFISIYGIKVLDVTNTEWLYNAGDLTQHQIGWTFFRNSDWEFPLGYMRDYAHPFGVAITYTDSIPIVAIILKLFRDVLPENFQYFGLWMLGSFIMQGSVAAIILKKYTENLFVIFMGIIPFLIAPILLRRVFIHTALASHWIILIAIAFWVYRKAMISFKIQIIAWGILNGLAVCIHPYFVPMIFTIMCGTLLVNLIESNKVKELFILPITSFLAIVIPFWIVGGFTGESLPAYGFGKFSMNLNALFNPLGWSRVLPDIGNKFFEQYEGLQYIGLGFIIMMPLVIVLSIMAINLKEVNFNKLIGFLIRSLPYMLVILVLIIISVSNVITYNEHILFSYEMPKVMRDVLEIFRSTGRLFWPVTYMIMFLIIILIIRNLEKTILVLAVLTVLVGVQIYDISHVIFEKQSIYKVDQKFDTILKSNLWNEVGAEYENIMILPAYTSTYSFFSKLATENEMTLNIGSFARAPYDKIYGLVNETAQKLIAGEYEEHTLYVIQHFGLLNEIMTNDIDENYKVVKVDNTDNCFAIFSKNTKIDLDKYKDMGIFTYKDFKKVDFSNYIDYLKNLPKDVAVIASTNGDFREYMTEEMINKMQEIGLMTDEVENISSSSFAGIISKSTNLYREEIYTNDISYIDYPAGHMIGDYPLKRIINVNASSRKGNNFSNMLLDGFQHSIDNRGMNFLIYDIKKNEVLNMATFNPDKTMGEMMSWN